MNARTAKRGFRPSNCMQTESPNGEFIISTDRRRLQLTVIHKYLSEESYWAQERTAKQTATAIKNSLPFGVYKGENQVGFARRDRLRDVRLPRRCICSARVLGQRIGQIFDANDSRASRFAKFPALDFSDERRARALRKIRIRRAAPSGKMDGTNRAERLLTIWKVREV